MKKLICLLSLVLSFSTLASSGETKTFVFDGSQNSVELLLKGEKTHTEYKVEQRQSICYREEVVGYNTVCTGGPRPHPGGYRGGRYGGGYYRGGYGPSHCTRFPVYRTVSYPCIETIRIPYEVKDYDVDARVILDITKLNSQATPGETFKVTLSGDELSLKVEGSRKFFVVLKKQDVQASMRGSVKFLDGLYAAELIEVAPVVRALSMSRLSMNYPVLSFNLGQIENKKHIGFALDVTHKRPLASNTTVIDRVLSSSEVQVDDNSLVSINFNQLSVDLNGKYSITPKAFFKHEGTLLNKAQFGEELEVSKTLIYKI